MNKSSSHPGAFQDPSGESGDAGHAPSTVGTDPPPTLFSFSAYRSQVAGSPGPALPRAEASPGRSCDRTGRWSRGRAWTAPVPPRAPVGPEPRARPAPTQASQSSASSQDICINPGRASPGPEVLRAQIHPHGTSPNPAPPPRPLCTEDGAVFSGRFSPNETLRANQPLSEPQFPYCKEARNSSIEFSLWKPYSVPLTGLL